MTLDLVQVFRREMLGEELLIDMEFAWTGSQKFQLQVWLNSLLSGIYLHYLVKQQLYAMLRLVHTSI